MNSFFKSRRLYRTIVLYLGSSWVVLEAFSYFMNRFNYPTYFEDILMIFLGFGLVLFIINEYNFTRKTNIGFNRTLLALNAVVLLLAGSTAYFYWQRAVKSQIQHARVEYTGTSIAVLPFKNLSPDSSYYWIGDGICDQLRSQLNQIESIDVKSRSASDYFKGKDYNPVQIAGLLGINTMLDGSIMVLDSMFRINVTLSNPINGSEILNETFEGKIDNIFDLQSEIALNIAQKINAKVTSVEKEQISKKLTNNPQAMEFFVMGKYHFNMITPVDNMRANQLFKKAIQHDPDFVMAHAYLGLTVQMFGGFWLGMMPDSAYHIVDNIVDKIYSIDQDNAIASYLNGSIVFFYNREYREGLQLIEEAYKMLDYKEDVIWFYCMMLSMNRQADKAVAILEDYIKMNPTSGRAYQGLCQARLIAKGRAIDTPIEYFNEPCFKCAELDPTLSYGRYYLAELHFMRKEFAKSRVYWQNMTEIAPIPMFHEGLMRASYYLGDTALAMEYYDKVLAASHMASPIQMARVYSTLDKIDSVEKYLNIAFAISDIELVALWNEPAFDKVRDEPKFQAIAKKLENAGPVMGGKTIFE